MPYKIDFFDDEVVEWTLTDDGAVGERVLDFTPTFLVKATIGLYGCVAVSMAISWIDGEESVDTPNPCKYPEVRSLLSPTSPAVVTRPRRFINLRLSESIEFSFFILLSC